MGDDKTNLRDRACAGTARGGKPGARTLPGSFEKTGLDATHYQDSTSACRPDNRDWDFAISICSHIQLERVGRISDAMGDSGKVGGLLVAWRFYPHGTHVCP